MSKTPQSPVDEQRVLGSEEEEGQGRKEKNGAWYQVCRGEKDSAGPVCVGVTVKDRGGDEGRCKSCEKEGFALLDRPPPSEMPRPCPVFVVI